MGDIRESYDTNRVALGDVLPLDTPFTVILDSSEICNLRCNYCFRSDDDKRKWGNISDQRMMGWKTFIKAVEQIKEFPNEVKQISLSHHGEPLTNRLLPQMASYIKTRGIKSRVSIHTNATLLDENYIEELSKSQIDRVVVSIQGLDSKTYNEKCNAVVDFDELYEKLFLFYRRKTNTQICVKIANTALSEGEQNKFYNLFQPISDRVFVEQIIPLWNNVDIKDADTLSRNKYGHFFKRQHCCPLVFHTIVVLPNGDVYPCTQPLMKVLLGNIERDSLLHLWSSVQRSVLLKEQLEMNKTNICSECAILNNSIYAKEDMIDDYREQILERIISIYG